MSEQPSGPTDGEHVPTVEDRLRAQLSEARILMHLASKRLLLDGEIVTDLDTPAPPGTRITVARS